jgi:hypothetical protein
MWVSFAALCWTLWNTRNKFTIEDVFPSQPADGLYKLSIYMQVWKPLAKRQDKEELEKPIGKSALFMSWSGIDRTSFDPFLVSVILLVASLCWSGDLRLCSILDLFVLFCWNLFFLCFCCKIMW